MITLKNKKRGVGLSVKSLNFFISFLLLVMTISLLTLPVNADDIIKYSNNAYPELTISFSEPILLSNVTANVRCANEDGNCFQLYDTLDSFATVSNDGISVQYGPNSDSSVIVYSLNRPLLSDTYLFETTVSDLLGNELIDYEITLIVDSESESIELIEPIQGWANSTSFDIVVETQLPGSCWANQEDFKFSPNLDNTHLFTDSTSGMRHTISNIAIWGDDAMVRHSPYDLYVVCNSSNAANSNKIYLGHFILAWDDTPPNLNYHPEFQYTVLDITEPYVDMIIESDYITGDPPDEIACRLKNLTEDGISIQNSPYEFFPNINYSDLWNYTKTNTKRLDFSYILDGGTPNGGVHEPHEYRFEVSCRNTARLKPTPFERIYDITVQFADTFRIEKLLPHDYVNANPVFIEVKTSVVTDACNISAEGASLDEIEQMVQIVDEKTYAISLSGLEEGTHSYEVTCYSHIYTSSGLLSFDFVVDRTSPSLLDINSLVKTCSLNSFEFELYAEDNVGLNYFKYNFTGVNVSIQNIINSEDTEDTVNVEFDDLELIENQTYTITAWVYDLANNSKGPVTKTITASKPNDLVCDLYPPSITLNVINESMGEVTVKLNCQDSGSGCSDNYILERLGNLSHACSYYSGHEMPFSDNIIISYDTKICAQAHDLSGNSVNKSWIIEVPTNLPQYCQNNVKDEDESGIDCGGSCVGCSLDSPCFSSTDCVSGMWCDPTLNLCKWASCDDKIMNGQETDIDCGGPDCTTCSINSSCLTSDDCDSNYCTAEGICSLSSCSDGIMNGFETDDDCGGPDCTPCQNEKDCDFDTDCQSGCCNYGTCDDCSSSPSPLPPPPPKDIVSLILLIVGIVLILAGSAYLYYLHANKLNSSNTQIGFSDSLSDSRISKSKQLKTHLTKEQLLSLTNRKKQMRNKFKSRKTDRLSEIETTMSEFDEKTLGVKKEKKDQTTKKVEKLVDNMDLKNKQDNNKTDDDNKKIKEKLSVDFPAKDFISLKELEESSVELMNKDKKFKDKVMTDVFAQLEKLHATKPEIKKAKQKDKLSVYYDGVIPVEDESPIETLEKTNSSKKDSSKTTSKTALKITSKISKNSNSKKSKSTNSMPSSKKDDDVFLALEKISNSSSKTSSKKDIELKSDSINFKNNLNADTDSMINLFKTNELNIDVFKVILSELLNSKKLNKQDVSGIIFRLLEQKLIKESKANKILTELGLLN